MGISKSAKTVFSAVLCTMFPVVLFAHPGHGQEGTVAHDLVHAAWIAAIVAVIALPVLRWWKAGADKDRH